jgi:predicted lactoylglutathione lyase
MKTSIFVNLPVKDLDKAKEFYTKLGYTINEQFTDETAASVVISDTVYVMLLTYAKFKEFTNKEIVDAKASTEVLLALSFESKEAVDEVMKKALEAGGTETRKPQDYGFMYARSFEDLDGHVWEPMWMEPSYVK